MVGKISRTSITPAAARHMPVPPSSARAKGVSRKTAAKPYTTVGTVVMKRTRDSVKRTRGCRAADSSVSSQQLRPTARGQPSSRATAARARDPTHMGRMPNLPCAGCQTQSRGPPGPGSLMAGRAAMTTMAKSSTTASTATHTDRRRARPGLSV